ncbi:MULTISPECIES: DUF4013 domain-containing protein [Halorussus]|uniref:DUF4013 domain-containing protein n=1 Tax=Halorussus TaxID=1070314 RepID=UPI00209FBF38|nr:DUF4013 domain-containing protein [Halorussus vallis]USZ77833.1 DUF4013 domain-containing protein [Halorussus vallis]
MSRRLISESAEFSAKARTLLLGGFLVTTGNVLFVFFVVGYLVKVVEVNANRRTSVPEIGGLKELTVDGLAGLAIWTTCHLPALLTLFYMGEVFFITTDGFRESASDSYLVSLFDLFGIDALSEDYFTALVDWLGIGIGGAGGVSRDLLRILQDVAVATNTVPSAYLAGDPHGIEGGLRLAYVASLLFGLYLTPAMMAYYADRGTAVSTEGIRRVSRFVFSYRYVKNWLVASALWTTSGFLFVLWNAWRTNPRLVRRPEWTIERVGFLPVVRVPTQLGMVSTLFLLSAGILSFAFLVIGYSLVGTAWGDSQTERRS